RVARRLRRDGAWEYREALEAGLLDPSCSEATRRSMISRHARREAQTRLNPLAFEPFTEEKLTFSRHCEAVGIPSPALYGAVGRAGGWCAATGRLVNDAGAFAAMVARLPERFVVKPTWGYYGLGVRALERRAVDARALHAELAADPEFDLFLVQELLVNHPEVEALTGSPVLQTVRLNTIVRRDGDVVLVLPTMKLATGSGDADNYRSGETGNGLCDVDPVTGALGPVTTLGPEGRGATSASVLPNGRRVEGWRLPMYQEACALVRDAAPHMLPMRTIGWDVAITPGGPVVVEANNYWGIAFTGLTGEERALFLEG
ncbi:MAG TPA: sugar-transfer associated ATP-grasp domain-containing protein, partial [Miltoncostaea sp.]|nr:sugar-transfer associated ATP-grasp domain-containing protein [Miltoncostaea sp.]